MKFDKVQDKIKEALKQQGRDPSFYNMMRELKRSGINIKEIEFENEQSKA